MLATIANQMKRASNANEESLPMAGVHAGEVTQHPRGHEVTQHPWGHAEPT